MACLKKFPFCISKKPVVELQEMQGDQRERQGEYREV